MRRMILAVALACVPLAACNGMATVPGSPGAVADKTVLDEKLMIGMESAYKGARSAAEVATDAGFLKGANAAKVADLDNKAYAALGTMRTAYKAANATSYVDAGTQALSAINQIVTIVAGVQK